MWDEKMRGKKREEKLGYSPAKERDINKSPRRKRTGYLKKNFLLS